VTARIVTIGPPVCAREEGRLTVSACLTAGGNAERVWYRVPDGAVAAGADAFAAAALPIAMRTHSDLAVHGALSPRLRRAVPAIQDIYHAWNPAWAKIQVHARDASPDGGAAGSARVGLFFSGGVDSFYVLLKRQDEIDTLLFIHGYDLALEQAALRRAVAEELRRAAARTGKRLLEVETNLHQISDRFVEWEFYHGAMLASVALLLGPRFARVYIPATHSYATLIPWGSHPLLDPLWSTDATAIVHDGCEASRFERVAAIAGSDAALQSLRVCWQNPGGAYNCGRCEKYLRTVITLRILGALDRCPTFSRPLSLSAVARMRPLNPPIYALENLRALEARGTDPALARALRDSIRGRYYRGLWGLGRAVWRAGRTMRGRLRRFAAPPPPPTVVNR
jgi:hypothetical protein